LGNKEKKSSRSKKKVEKAKQKVKPFGKKGESRTISPRTRIYFPPELKANKLHTKTTKPRTATLRKSITPGTVVILLNGKFAGKRVVFLKQLASGLLLVAGPFKINGVPLKRVDQRFVIATSAKIDVGTTKIDVDDSFFKKEHRQKQKKGEEGFFAEKKRQRKRLYHLQELKLLRLLMLL